MEPNMEIILEQPVPDPVVTPMVVTTDNSDMLQELVNMNMKLDTISSTLTSLNTYLILIFIILSVYCGYSLAERIVKR